MTSEENESQSGLIKTIEELLAGIIDLAAYFLLILFSMLFRPSQLFSRKFRIRPLTFFSICLVIASTFWYLMFTSVSRFMSQIHKYVFDHDFEDITRFLFDSKVLTQALTGLIPLIIIILISLKIVAFLFSIKSKNTQLHDFTFYFIGSVLMIGPLAIIPLVFAVAFLIGGKDDRETYLTTLIPILALCIFLGLLILTFRSLWIGCRHFFASPGKYRLIRTSALMTCLLMVCGFTISAQRIFHVSHQDRSQVHCKIVSLEKPGNDPDDQLSVKVLLTNHADIAQPISLSGLSLEIQPGSMSPTVSVDSIEVSKGNEALHDTLMLKSREAVLFTAKFLRKSKGQLRIFAASDLEKCNCMDVIMNFVIHVSVLGENEESVESSPFQLEVGF